MGKGRYVPASDNFPQVFAASSTRGLLLGHGPDHGFTAAWHKSTEWAAGCRTGKGTGGWDYANDSQARKDAIADFDDVCGWSAEMRVR